MRILVVSYHCCSRVLRQTRALLRCGERISMLHHIEVPPVGLLPDSWEGLPNVPSVYHYDTKESFDRWIRYFRDSGVQLIHVHNEPNWLGYHAKQQAPDIPLVFDAHDLDYARKGISSYDEVTALNAADAVIFPSWAYEAEIKKAKWFPEDIPTRVIYSILDQDMFVQNSLPRTGGIVYEGGCAGQPDVNEFRHRDYREFCKTILKMGLPLALYGVRPEYYLEYLETGADVHQMVPFQWMLWNLSRYDWGFVVTSIVWLSGKWLCQTSYLIILPQGFLSLL